MKSFLQNLLNSKGNISTMRFVTILCTVSACYIAILLAYNGITAEGVGLVTSLLTIATGGKVWQKKYENNDEPINKDESK